MTPDLLTGLLIFALVGSLTPGPNTLMVMASGANFGYRRTLPHMMGIMLGFMAMVALMGLGLSRIFDMVPVLEQVLTVCAVLYMLWLAWKIAHAAPLDASAKASKPLTFLQAAAFQWVNPKAWAFAITAVTVYTQDTGVGPVLIVAGMLGLVSFPSTSLWTVIGLQVARVLTDPRRRAIFNWGMAGLLLLSLYPAIAAAY